MNLHNRSLRSYFVEYKKTPKDLNKVICKHQYSNKKTVSFLMNANWTCYSTFLAVMQFSFKWICTRSAHTFIMAKSFSSNWCSTGGFLALILKTQKLFTGTLSPFCGSSLGRVFVVGGSSSETTERDEWFLLQPLLLLPSLSIQPYGTGECVKGIAAFISLLILT